MLKLILKQNKIFAVLFAVLISLFTVLTSFAEDSPAENNEPPEEETTPIEIQLESYNINLEVGTSYALNATVLNSGYEDPQPTYQSSDTNVATVDEYGTVEAVGEGTAEITVSYEGVYTQAVVTVTAPEEPTLPPVEILLDNYYISMEVGNGVQLYPTVLNSNTDYPQLSYQSSDTNVARVDNLGYIMAIGEGTALITVSYGDAYVQASVTVTKPAAVPDYIVITENNFKLKKGATAQIKAKLIPEETAGGYTLSYESDNENIASVNEKGVITAHERGTALITVFGANLTGTVKVEVTDDVAYKTCKLDGYLYNNEGKSIAGAKLVIDKTTAVTDNKGYFSFAKAEQRELTLKIEGDNNAICKITPNGNTTVYLLYESRKALKRLSSYEELAGHLPVKSVNFLTGNVVVTVGETYELEYQYTPKDAHITEIEYSGSNDISVTVGKVDGVISAKAAGEADITLSLNGGQATTICHVVVNPKESSDYSLIIAFFESLIIVIAVVILINVYKKYKKKLSRKLDEYDETDLK